MEPENENLDFYLKLILLFYLLYFIWKVVFFIFYFIQQSRLNKRYMTLFDMIQSDSETELGSFLSKLESNTYIDDIRMQLKETINYLSINDFDEYSKLIRGVNETSESYHLQKQFLFFMKWSKRHPNVTNMVKTHFKKMYPKMNVDEYFFNYSQLIKFPIYPIKYLRDISIYYIAIVLLIYSRDTFIFFLFSLVVFLILQLIYTIMVIVKYIQRGNRINKLLLVLEKDEDIGMKLGDTLKSGKNIDDLETSFHELVEQLEPDFMKFQADIRL